MKTNQKSIQVGLRVDVDTLRGTRVGVPNLIKLLGCFQIWASFFFSLGPDNMGRHLWRLLRPAFLLKMLRTRAASLYGWDILLRGTLFPGPLIGKRCQGEIQAVAGAGHEVGLHAWDHHLWQTSVDKMGPQSLTAEIRRGMERLESILGRPPECFAAPGWRVTPEALLALERFPLRYQSDCRGHSVFQALIQGRRISHIQVPTTLPTYDELIGRHCSQEIYNESLLEMIRPGRLNVLTIHAEVEGIHCLGLFQDFLQKAGQRGLVFQALGDILSQTKEIPSSGIRKTELAGRDGWLASQETSS
ncbi:MAG: 4-deoxy-4-formamido-L-arabinose-phosphoundecaprenol deformylase [Desulfohalobiaceae bacterium]|nr:4-deoxy-4-formamido-L-arabinose-phosphoundecaprenol deformylase [Desulfohalobiaceae bacterium]